MLPRILFVAGLVLLCVGVYTQAYAEITTPYFGVVGRLNDQGVLSVVERIEVDFGAEERHGIFRKLPRSLPHLALPPDYRNIFVADADGVPIPFESSQEVGQVVLKIGDPNTYVSGIQRYVITYEVRDVVRFGRDTDEMVWNVTGGTWDLPIMNVEGVLVLGMRNAQLSRTSCVYHGGAIQAPCALESRNDEAARYSIVQSGVAPRASVYMNTSFPHGLVILPRKEVPLSTILLVGGVLLIALAFVGTLLFVLGRRRGGSSTVASSDWRQYIEGKRVTVMGLGLLGRGIGDVRFLHEYGAIVTVTDLKSEEALAPALESLADCSGITYVLGEHRFEDFESCDFVLKAAGVPLDSPYIAHARERGVPIEMSTALFADLSGMPIIGVTGTRGKSTTTHLIHHMLTHAGVKALLGGNVQGVSTLAQLPRAHEYDVAVLELDSWQLQGFHELHLSPSIAVFTTFFPDHLNYYGTLERYFEDKTALYRYQREGDTLIVGEQVADRIEQDAHERKGSYQVVGPGTLPSEWECPLVGGHNRYNAALAVAALRTWGVDDDAIRKGLATFPGVPGRLQLLSEKHGVLVYNDTTATTPEATIAALHAFPGKRVVLIAGGADKGLALEDMADAIRSHTAHVCLLEGTGTTRLRPLVPKAKVYKSLRTAFVSAWKKCEQGDILLLSPGFASFGMFQNEFDRGEQFRTLVDKL